MLNILLQTDLLGKLIEIAINAHTHISAFSSLIQHLDVLALSPPDHWRQKLKPGALRHLHDLIHHLVNGLLVDLPAALGTVRNPHSGVEKPHIVVYLCHRSHSGAGIAVGRLLVNRNSRRQTLDTLHIRFLHLTQKLTGIGR